MSSNDFTEFVWRNRFKEEELIEKAPVIIARFTKYWDIANRLYKNNKTSVEKIASEKQKFPEKILKMAKKFVAKYANNWNCQNICSLGVNS